MSEAIGFTEGNSEEWRWFVPHDLEGLVDLFGGPEIYAQVIGDVARRWILKAKENWTRRTTVTPTFSIVSLLYSTSLAFST